MAHPKQLDPTVCRHFSLGILVPHDHKVVCDKSSVQLAQLGRNYLVEDWSLKVALGSVVCLDADYIGDITIGAKTIVHPKARIFAEAGPIIIGEGNLIEEQAEIINRLPEGTEKSCVTPVLIIGNNNVFEVDSHCFASHVGDNNVFESKCYVGRNVDVTNGCIITSLCHLTCPEVLPENTVVYGSQLQRRVQSEKPVPQGQQLDFLAKVLPNYHHLVKPKKKIEEQH